MAIKKQFLKSKPVCKVTFSIPEKEATSVSVVGNWNNWNPKKQPLKKLKNGKFTGTIDLETGKDYQFRYLIDGQWKNEQDADTFEWNEYAGTENCVLKL